MSKVYNSKFGDLPICIDICVKSNSFHKFLSLFVIFWCFVFSTIFYMNLINLKLVNYISMYIIDL